MSKSLFKKGKKSTLTSEHDEIWDDSLLIKAYEESVRLQKEDIAKHLAMKTNKQKPEEESSDASVGSSGANKIFEAGDFVRSTFAEDGVDYEAEIISINENNTCLIRFIGYGNEERVKMEELVDSWGPEAREEQKILAEADQVCSNGVDGNHQEELFSFVADKAQGSQKSLPVPPMPAMPPGMFDSSKDSEYMSAMLMSWYMSGYYTGLYHGRKQAIQEIQPQASSSIRPNSTTPDKETSNKKRKTKKIRN